jgi:hypothetical protein
MLAHLLKYDSNFGEECRPISRSEVGNWFVMQLYKLNRSGENDE